MIATVSVKATTGHPNIPLAPIVMFRASAATIGVTDAPRSRCGTDVTGVNITLTTPDGVVRTEAAKLCCGVWCATFAATDAVGFVSGGLFVTATGMDEDGTAREWSIGEGDVTVLDADGSVTPGEHVQIMHFRDGLPSAPVKGDVYEGDGGFLLFDGEGWKPLGGGGGAVESVNGQTGAVVLTGDNIKTRADDPDAYTITDKIDSDYEMLMDHIGLENNPHGVTAEQVGAIPTSGGEFVDRDFDLKVGVEGGIALKSDSGDGFAQFGSNCDSGVAIKGSTNPNERSSIKIGGKEVATEDQLRVTMQLVGNGPYTVALDGVTLTFAQIKAFAQTRNAVIQRGQGTYRVTYIGANEMMWDVTGTVAGEVLTGQIHIFDQNGATVVQRVEPKTLATEEFVTNLIGGVAEDLAAAIDGEVA